LSITLGIPAEEIGPDELLGLGLKPLVAIADVDRRALAELASRTASHLALKPPEATAEEPEVESVLRRAMNERLNSREKVVLELRYGLDGRGPRRDVDIALELGLSRERIRQIALRAERLIRDHGPLHEYMALDDEPEPAKEGTEEDAEEDADQDADGE
jgi:hypothetical protein